MDDQRVDRANGEGVAPRFSFTTLIIVFTIVALWLSTLTGYPGSDDLRAFIALSFVIVPGVAAMGSTGRRRAFWVGFFGTMLALSVKGVLMSFGASFRWAPEASRNIAMLFIVPPGKQGELTMGINTTIIFVVALIAATAMGVFCAYVYDQVRKP